MIDPLDILLLATLGTSTFAVGSVAIVTIGTFAPRCGYHRRGGLRFLRIGRLRVSFCFAGGSR